MAITREQTVRVRMTKGEAFMLKVKATREGRSSSEVIRQAILEYEPRQPEPSLCLNCLEGPEEEFWDNYFAEAEAEEKGASAINIKENAERRVQMEPIWYSETRNISVAANTPEGYEEHKVTYTGIPAERCPVCGTVRTNYGLMLDIEEAEVRLVNHFIRLNKGWPEEISLEELSRLM
ncbi:MULTISPECIES: plasmid mobilization protein [Desulfitobacterium]